ncbi:MAG TPA: hypothetical protein VKU38_22220 [Ktedonobacteraceae bacterium]|nr:hypothetical protein [Ktedonobacteraceae bacterium]
MKHKIVWLVPVLVLAMILLPWLRMNASAASTQLSSHPQGMFLRPVHPNGNGPNVVYHGGAVMNGTSHTYAIFWEPKGSKVSPNYNSLLLRYLHDVGNTGLYHNLVQYTDSQGKFPTGSKFGASWIDSQTAYPGPVLTDAQIQNEVTHAMKVNGWTATLQHLFIVFTALNENNTAGTAYHGDFNGNTVYATVPDIFAAWHIIPGPSPNHDVAADSSILVTSHEQNEAASDATPFIKIAWIDPQGLEIGDKCETFFGHVNSDGSNVHWNGHAYIVQGEWDNAKHGCTLVGP